MTFQETFCSNSNILLYNKDNLGLNADDVNTGTVNNGSIFQRSPKNLCVDMKHKEHNNFSYSEQTQCISEWTQRHWNIMKDTICYYSDSANKSKQYIFNFLILFGKFFIHKHLWAQFLLFHIFWLMLTHCSHLFVWLAIENVSGFWD